METGISGKSLILERWMENKEIKRGKNCDVLECTRGRKLAKNLCKIIRENHQVMKIQKKHEDNFFHFYVRKYIDL